MNKNVVLTLTGHDRVDLQEVTNIFVKYGGNVETSRMARLAGICHVGVSFTRGAGTCRL